MKRVLVAVAVVALGAGVYFVATQDDAESPKAAEATKPDDPNVVTKAPPNAPRSLLPKTFPGQEPPKPEELPPEERDRTLTEEELNPVTGIEMVPATEADRQHAKVPDKRWGTGVLVMHVDPDSPADEVRMKKGDLIVRAQHSHVNKPQDLIDAAKGRDHVVVTFVREGQYLQVVLKKPYEPDKD